MIVKIIRPTIAQKRQVFAGDVLEVSKDEAVQLIGANKAVAVKDNPVETATLPMAEQAAVVVEQVQPAETPDPVKPSGKKKKASENP